MQLGTAPLHRFRAITLNGTGIANDGALRKIGNQHGFPQRRDHRRDASRINSDAGTLNITGAPTLTATATFGGVGATTIAGVISGAGGIVKDGAGTLTLTTATNTFTGAVNINGGVLSIDSSNRITPNGTATVTIDGGVLRHTSGTAGTTFITTSHPIVIGDAGGTIDISNAAGIIIYAPTATATLITPATAGAGVITKTGPGTFRTTNGGFTANMTVQKLVVTGGLWQTG